MAKLSIDDILKQENLSAEEVAALPEVPNPQMGHIPVVFLVDNSSSMGTSGSSHGSKIEQLNRVLAKFFQDIIKGVGPYDKLRQHGDFLIISYGKGAAVAMPWTHGTKLKMPPTFQADGGTPMGAALVMATEMLLDQYRAYDHAGTSAYCGVVYNLTDGGPTDMKIGDVTWKRARTGIELFEYMGSRNNAYANFVHLAVDGADIATLVELAGGVSREQRVIPIDQYDISKLAEFVMISLKANLSGVSIDTILKKPA